MTHNVFSWPYHVVLSSSFSAGVLNQRPTVSRRPSEVLSVTASWDSKTHSDWDPYVSICIYNFKRPQFPINHVTAFAYLQRCVLSREISDWRLGQESVCNNIPTYLKREYHSYICAILKTSSLKVFWIEVLPPVVLWRTLSLGKVWNPWVPSYELNGSL